MESLLSVEALARAFVIRFSHFPKSIHFVMNAIKQYSFKVMNAVKYK